MDERLFDRRLAEAVAAIYSAAPVPSSWPNTLQAIADVFDDFGAIMLYQRGDGSSASIVSPSMAPAQAAYADEWWRQDVRVLRAIERGYLAAGDMLTDRHVVTDAEISTLPFYTEFLANQNLAWFAGANISPDPHLVAGLSIQRVRGRPAFSAAELSTLGWLSRHVENSLRLGARLFAAELTNLALEEALTRLDVGVFLADASGSMSPANQIASQLIGSALVLSNGRPMARFEPERTLLREAVAAAVAGPADPRHAPRPIVIHGVGETKYAVAYVLPVAAAGIHSFGLELADVRALVIVRRAGRGDPIDPSLVRDILNLTLGESRVAALVGAGIPPKAAAERLGITEETVRTVLKRVFAKSGISRQGDLAALLTRLVLG